MSAADSVMTEGSGFLFQLQAYLGVIGDWAVPLLIVSIPVYGLIRGVKVYEAFVEGAKEGFDVAVRIMPFLVAILVAIGLFRDLGAMNILAYFVDPITSLIGMPTDVLPLAIIRPLSGGAAAGVMASLLEEHGPDSFIGQLASVMNGSTDTTFYILAVYFGSVGIRKTRHAVLCGLTADVAGIIASVLLCTWYFGHLLKP